MTPRNFNDLVKKTQDECMKVLLEKEKQYGSQEDRLIQFETAGILQNVNTITALGGMMSKHTTKLYMMINKGSYSDDDWNEVITDHINYLYLLKGVLEDGKTRSTSSR